MVTSILSREQRELEQQYREEKHQPEAVFIQEAINLLQDRILQVQGIYFDLDPDPNPWMLIMGSDVCPHALYDHKRGKTEEIKFGNGDGPNLRWV